MISFDLCCSKGHRFEGWFGSLIDYDTQQSDGLVICPVCDDAHVQKMLSVPNVGRKGNQGSPITKITPVEVLPVDSPVTNAPVIPAKMVEIMQKLASAQTEMLKKSEWVGRDFAETARAIHYGESDDRLIHGEASPDEAEALAEEGVSVMPLPFRFIPPEAKN